MMRTRKQGHVILTVLAVTVVVLGIGWRAKAEQIETDTPSYCLLTEGVSWLPVDWLPQGLQEQVTDQTISQTINGVRFIRIKQFVEAHGGSVGWDSGAEAVIVEFEGQSIAFKALHSGRFWVTPRMKTFKDELLSVNPDSEAECSAESRTDPSEQWEPPRLVDGVWISSGVPHEVAERAIAEARRKREQEERNARESAQVEKELWDEMMGQHYWTKRKLPFEQWDPLAAAFWQGLSAQQPLTFWEQEEQSMRQSGMDAGTAGRIIDRAERMYNRDQTRKELWNLGLTGLVRPPSWIDRLLGVLDDDPWY